MNNDNAEEPTQLKIVDPFYHPPKMQTKQQGKNYGNYGYLQNLAGFNIGTGASGVYGGKEGLWIGHRDIAQAKFAADIFGKVTLRDELGQTILDPAGIRSDTQFLSSTIEDFTDRTTTLATAQDIDFTELTLDIRRLTSVYISCSITGYINGLSGGLAGAAPIGNVQLKIDGALVNFILKLQSTRMYTPEATGLSDTGLDSKSYQKLEPFEPGSHAISLAMFLSAAGGYTLHITETSVTYVTFGK